MYAIFVTGGKQYRAEVGSEIFVEKLEVEAEQEVVFDQVLLVSDEAKTEVGAPTVKNAKVFISIVSEFGSFLNYLRSFWNGETIYDCKSTFSPLSDLISNDLKKRGMSFVGTMVIHSFLQAIGIVNAHNEECFLYNTELW